MNSKNYTILLVVNPDVFTPSHKDRGEGTYDDPFHINWNSHPNGLWMITDPTIAGDTNATNNLAITVRPGDTITWLDTTISQGVHDQANGDQVYDMPVYAMEKSGNWSTYLSDLIAITPAPSRTQAYITTNFDNGSQPTFQATTVPNNACRATVLPNTTAGTVTYNLRLAKLNVTNASRLTEEKYYQFDPTIRIVPNA